MGPKGRKVFCKQHDLEKICAKCAQELLRWKGPQLHLRKLQRRQLPMDLRDPEEARSRLRTEVRNLRRSLREASRKLGVKV